MEANHGIYFNLCLLDTKSSFYLIRSGSMKEHLLKQSRGDEICRLLLFDFFFFLKKGFLTLFLLHFLVF